MFYDGAAFRLYGTNTANGTFTGTVTAGAVTAGTVGATTVAATTLIGNGAAVTNVNAVTLGGNSPAYYQPAITPTTAFEVGTVKIGTLTATTITGNGAAVTNVDAVKLGGQSPAYYQRALIDLTNLELGATDSGDRASSIDLHSSNAVDFSARLIREAGVNGNLVLTQTGTGAINITGGSVLQRNGNTIFDTSMFNPATKRDVTPVALTANTDLNTIIANGTYTQTAGATVGANYPSGNGGALFVTAAGGNVSQIYQSFSSTDLWYRSYNGTSWFAWKKVNTATIIASTAAPTGGVDGDLWFKV